MLTIIANTATSLQSVDSYPGVLWYILEDWYKELYTPVPVSHEEHQENELANPQDSAGHIEHTCQ